MAKALLGGVCESLLKDASHKQKKQQAGEAMVFSTLNLIKCFRSCCEDCTRNVLEAAGRPVWKERVGDVRVSKRSSLYELVAPFMDFAFYLAADGKPLYVSGRAT